VATNFLEATGTSGFIATQAVTISLSGLAIGAAVLGSTVFTAGTGGTLLGAQKAHAWFTVVTTAFTPTAGGVFACWFLLSTDNGTTFEADPLLASASASIMAMPRSPDFVIPLDATSQAAGNIKFAQGPFRLPYVAFKVAFQNLSGVALSAAAHTLTLGGVADQY
jgi:hypothetical protein